MNFVGRQGHGSVGGWGVEQKGTSDMETSPPGPARVRILANFTTGAGREHGSTLHCPLPPPSSPAEMLQSAPAPRSGMKGTVKGQP